MSRPTKDDYFLGIAEAVAKRSTCIRRQYGAVIVKNDVIVSTGYNGSPRNAENCCDNGYCWREANNILHGERYEMCQAVHAEANAITKIACSNNSSKGATMYVTTSPCIECAKLIIQAGIKRVIYSEKYRLEDGLDLLRRANIEVVYLNPNE